MGEYLALYRKWRPVVFGDVVGQTHVTDTLKNEIINNRIAHAYLFCGTRGTGKTSTAKIFSRAINCLSPQDGDPCNECEACTGILSGRVTDVYEMDAASNNGVDNIREIRDEVAYAPSFAKYKIYIIDEVHMLSGGAFNALLKTLEEPPKHVIFILATTEPHKIPATILSRCQRFDFKRIRIMDVAGRINKIAEAEGIDITPDAVEMLAEIAEGSMRDGLSALDLCSSYGIGKLKSADVAAIVGAVDKNSLFDIAECIVSGNAGEALIEIDELMDLGKEVLSLFEDLITHYRNMLICKVSDGDAQLIDKTEDAALKYKVQGDKYTVEDIMHCITVFSEYVLSAKWMSQPRVALEMAVTKVLCHKPQQTALDFEKPKTAQQSVKKDYGENSAVLPEKSEHAALVKPESAPQSIAPLRIDNSSDVPFKPALEINAAGKTEWRFWRDALDVIKKESKQLFGFLYPVKAYNTGNNVELVITNSIAYDRVKKPEGIKYLEDLFTRVSGVECTVTIEREVKTSEPAQKNVGGIEEIAKLKDAFGDIMIIEE